MDEALDPCYEAAPLTTMQLVARLTVALRAARLSARPGRLQACQQHVLVAARLADALKEFVIRDRASAVHAAMLTENRESSKVIRHSCLALEQAWDEILRENNTRYMPTYDGPDAAADAATEVPDGG